MREKYRKAVFVLAYAKTDKKIEYLLLKRKLHWKGWEFCKGKIEPKEKKSETARRELFEETGLKPLKGGLMRFNFSGKYNYKKSLPDRPKLIGQTFLLYAAEVKKNKVKLDKKEHSSHKWTTFSQALKMLTWSNQKKSLKIVNKFLKEKPHKT